MAGASGTSRCGWEDDDDGVASYQKSLLMGTMSLYETPSVRAREERRFFEFGARKTIYCNILDTLLISVVNNNRY
jgi:hypothetical protein